MPTTGETHTARVTAIQLESQNIERAGFPEWARQDMSHGSVILAMEDPIPPSLVGHPVEVRFIDTDSLGGEALATVFGTLSDLLRGVLDTLTAAFAADSGNPRPRASDRETAMRIAVVGTGYVGLVSGGCLRSDESRAGKECVSTFRSRWS